MICCKKNIDIILKKFFVNKIYNKYIILCKCVNFKYHW